MTIDHDHDHFGLGRGGLRFGCGGWSQRSGSGTMTIDHDHDHFGLGARKSTLWVSLVMVRVTGQGQLSGSLVRVISFSFAILY